MAKPVNIPNSFATSTSAIPLSYLDQDFNALANSTNDLATYSNYVADTGAANAYIANFPTNINTSSLTAGLRVQFKAANANTGTSTLNVQVNSVSIGSGTIKLTDGSNLPAGAIVAGALVDVMYDGTNFQLLSDSSGGAEVITNLTLSGNLAFTGTSNRITGDFSNATIANRVFFQNSVTNGNSNIGVMPNGTSTTSSLQLHNGTDPANAGFINLTVNSTAADLQSTIRGTGTYIPLLFSTGGSERMRIDTSGNVGIGINPVASKLTIAGTTADATAQATYVGTIQLNEANLTTPNAVGGIEFKTSVLSGVGYGSKIVGHNNGSLLFATRANSATFTETMRIDSNGNVGIGTSSPGGKFDVQGGRSYFAANSDAFATYLRYNNSTSGVFLGSPSANAFQISSSSGGAYLNIDSSGNVGIGTSSPGSKLQVSGGGTTYITITNTGVGDSCFVGRDATGAFVGSAGAYPLLLNTNNTERMRITSSGNVGIGGTPSNLLDVIKSQSADTIIRVYNSSNNASARSVVLFGNDTSGGSTGVYLNSSTNTGLAGANSWNFYQGLNAPISFSTNGTERMRIDSSGNVGIGTTSLTDKFTVAAANSQMRLIDTDDSTYCQFSYSSTALAIRINSTTADHFWLNSSGNLGIGTASPTALLTIAASSGSPGYNINYTGSPAATIAGQTANTSTGELRNFVYTNYFPTFYSNNAERMRIHSSGGVSIGNTTDSGAASLNVSGSMSGGYIAHAAGTTAMAFGADNVVRVTPNATATYTSTVPAAGAICVLSILTSGTTSYTITFGTGFKSTGTLATGTVSARYFNITFVSDGTNLIETSRTVAIA